MGRSPFTKNKSALIVISVVVVLGIAALGYWLLAPKKIAEVNPAFSKYIDAIWIMNTWPPR